MSQNKPTVPNCVCEACGKEFRCKPSGIAKGFGRFCSMTCRNTHGWKTRTSLAERLWSRVAPPDENGCRLWTGPVNSTGYGNIGAGGRCGPTLKAHRVAWELIFGPIPDGLNVLHKCDVPRCCAAAEGHLFLGTQTENLADMARKVRQARGERLHRSNLTNERVQEIRRRYADGETNQTQLGREFGVTQSTIWAIVTGRIWKHVTEAS